MLSLGIGRHVPILPVYAFFTWTGTSPLHLLEVHNWRLYTGTKLFLSGKITVRAKNSCNPCKVVPFLTGHE
jgi:hypothetical protein